MAKDKNIKILGWEGKPKSLVRYLNAGDYFAYQIGKDLYGWGQLWGDGTWGWTSIFFNHFTNNPDKFDITKPEQQERLFITVVDAYRVFQTKRRGDCRIIVQVKNFDNPHKDEFVTIAKGGVMHSADYSKEKSFSEDELKTMAQERPGMYENPRAYDSIVELLIHYAPEIFKPEHRPYLIEDYILEEFEDQSKPAPF